MTIAILLNSFFYKILRLVWPEKNKNNILDEKSWVAKHFDERLSNPKSTPSVIDTHWPPTHWIDIVKDGYDIPLAELSWFEILTNFNLFTYFTLQYWCFIPEFLIFLFLIVVILVREWNFKFLLKFTLVFFHSIFIFSVFVYLKLPPYVHFFFEDLCFMDNYIFIIKTLIFLIFQFFLLIIYHRFFDKKMDDSITKADAFHYKIVFILFLSFLFLSLVFVSTNDFFCFYIILEGLSFSLVFSCVLNFNKTYHILTSIRYFVYNLFVSGGLLLGIAFLYGLLGTTNFFYCKMMFESPFIEIMSASKFVAGAPVPMVISLLQAKSLIAFMILFFFGCFFKLGCFPFNFWILTVNQFISYEVSFIFNIIFKNLFFFVFFRICTYYLAPLAVYWSPLLLFFGYCSVFIGVLGAFGQKRIKSFLTFSSVVQIGYNLIGMSFTTFSSFASVFFLQFTYMFGNIILVGCLLYLSCDPRTLRSSRWRIRNIFYVLSDLQLLRQVSPLFAVVVSISILSMAGLPPTLGFFAKYYYYEVLIECGMMELCIVLLLLNGFSLYYYINILKNIWLATDYDSVNTIYIPWFRWEIFMVFTTCVFCLLNIFAMFVHKHILFLLSKLSLMGSRVVFAQIYVFLMKYPLMKYLYLKSIYLTTEPHVTSYINKFTSPFSTEDPIASENYYINVEYPKGTIANSLLERDMLIDKIVYRNIFPSWRSAFEDFSSDSEWTVFSTNSFIIYQFALIVLVVIIVWSFYIIYILRLERLFLAHPAVGSFKITTEKVKELVFGPFGFPIWWTGLFSVLHVLLYLDIF